MTNEFFELCYHKIMADSNNQVKLRSKDGQEFEIEVKAAKMSMTVKNLIEDAGIDNAIPLPNVTGKILSKTVEFCKHHMNDPKLSDKEERAKEILPWDKDFCNVDQTTLFDLILAANYLDIKPLLNLTCKTIAGMISGKTPEEIRKEFNIKNDFSKDEEAQILKENEWLEER